MAWLLIIVPSTLFGGLCAWLLPRKAALWCACGIPWLAVAAAIIYTEYAGDRPAPDASLWPIAIVFGGGAAAVIGITACEFAQRWLVRR